METLIASEKSLAKDWNSKEENLFLNRIEKHYCDNKKTYNLISVSIIMPVYNRAYCIEKAISSILTQSHRNWSLIIIDDGSTDNIESILKKHLTDSRINLYKQEKRGVSSARNFGINIAKGKYLFFLDTDNVWFSNYLKNMIVYMEEGKLEACYSGMKLINDKKIITGYFGRPFDWNECLESNYIDINCFALHRKFIEKGFHFDNGLERLVDWDFILDVTANSRTAYAPFLGTEYYDGKQGNRITFNVHKGKSVQKVISKIQTKHKEKKDNRGRYEKETTPNWREIL